MKTLLPSLLLVLLLGSCHPKSDSRNLTYVKLEIVKTEKQFEKAVAQNGLAAAFYEFADSAAVIKREGDTLIVGKENIKKYYSDPKYQNISLSWTPVSITVAQAGDMAFSYGNYIWISKEPSGKEKISKGVFQSLWKKQKDGSWKYVWD